MIRATSSPPPTNSRRQSCGMVSVPRSYDSAVGVGVSELDYLKHLFFFSSLFFYMHAQSASDSSATSESGI